MKKVSKPRSLLGNGSKPGRSSRMPLPARSPHRARVDEVMLEIGKQRLQGLHPTCEQGVGVRGSRRPAAGCRLAGETIAFQYRDLAEVVCETPGLRQDLGHPGPEHDGMITQ